MTEELVKHIDKRVALKGSIGIENNEIKLFGEKVLFFDKIKED